MPKTSPLAFCARRRIKKCVCYFFARKAGPGRLSKRYGRPAPPEALESDCARAFEHPECPAVAAGGIETMTWGMVPGWLRPGEGESPSAFSRRAESFRKLTLNARCETLFEKPAFREAAKLRRCLVPATEYFEYMRLPSGRAVPHSIFMKGCGIFSMGGVFDFWTDPETGIAVRGFSIITTPANPLAAKIHNGGRNPFRMPFIVRKCDEEKWLDPGLTRAEAERLMAPFPEAEMAARELEGMPPAPVRDAGGAQGEFDFGK